MPYFPERLDETPGLLGRIVRLDEGAAGEISAGLWRGSIEEPETFEDLSRASTEEVRQRLASIGLPGESRVWLSYASDPTTVLEMQWATFVDHWDNFWYPSSDDVRIASTDQQPWIIEVTHEEELRVISRPG